MDDRAAWEREMVRVFLSEHDAPCPGCGYNLRGTPGDKCPECAAPLALGIRHDDPKSRWEMIGAIGAVVCTIYFCVTASVSVFWMLKSALSSPSVGYLRSYMWTGMSAHLILAVGSAAWCLAMLLARKRRPRPSWARPTNAAAGILLGSFVVYLVVYGLGRLLI